MSSRLAERKPSSRGRPKETVQRAPAPEHAQPRGSSLGASYGLGPAVALRAPIQAKLVVGQAGDRYEREADRVAQRVAGGQPAGDVSRIPAGGLQAQRQPGDPKTAPGSETGGARDKMAQTCASCEAAERAQRCADDGDHAQAAATEPPHREASAPEDNAQRCPECEKKRQEQRATPGAIVQRAEEGDTGGASETKDAQRDDETEEEEPQVSGPQEDETVEAKDCGAQTIDAEEDADGEEPAQAAAGPKGKDSDLGCGEESGEEETSQPSGAEPSCGAGAQPMSEEPATSAGAETADVGPVQEAEAPEPRAAVPACGDGVSEAVEKRDEPEPEAQSAAEPSADATAGGCAAVQRLEERGEAADETASRRPKDPDDASNVAAQRQEQSGAMEDTAVQERRDGEEQEQAQSAEAESEETSEDAATAQRASDDAESSAPEEQHEAESVGEQVQSRSTRPKRRKLDLDAATRSIHSRGTGEPLAPTVKSRLEASLGVGVEGVRVHADSNAHVASRALNAKAFTHRNHIFLGGGQSQHDLGLMAHEGTHVLQQDAIVRRRPTDGTSAGAASHGGDTLATSAMSSMTGTAKSSAPATTGRPAPEAAATSFTTPMPASSPTLPASSMPAGSPPPPRATVGPDSVPSATKAGRPGTEAKSRGAGRSSGGGRAKDATRGQSEAGGASASEERASDLGDPAARRDETSAAHPGAQAAAAARVSAEARGMATVQQRLGREAHRQKGPSATRARQRRASGDAATEASNAAPSPEAEPKSEAGCQHVKSLANAKGQPMDQVSFVDEVMKRVEALETPATLEEMDEFDERDGAAGLKQGLDAQVQGSVAGAKQPIHGTLEDPPRPPARRQEKALGAIPAAPVASGLRSAEAAPLPLREEEVTLDPNRRIVEDELSRHRLTKERLLKSNDPRFTAAQESREQVHEHAERAPRAFRRDESAALGEARRGLAGDETQGVAGMRRAHTAGQVTTRAHQGIAIGREHDERRRVATDIENLHQGVETDVRGKLEWLAGKEGVEGEVNRRFRNGEDSARTSFEEFVGEEMTDWKARRYGGRAAIPIVGGAIAAGTWVYDKLRGIDEHPDVVEIFKLGRQVYISAMKISIRAIAKMVEESLAWCEKRIARGKSEIDAYVGARGLSPSLRKVARQTASAVFERFDELHQDVDATRGELADRLVDGYRESRETIDQRIREMQAENRGLVRKFIDKVKEVIAAIRNFRNKIGPILAEAGDVVEDIIDDPIGFLGNLLDALKQGFGQFREHIGKHLREGVAAWLFGTLSGAGVELPKEFTPKAVGGLILQVLGLTYEKLRARVARMVGPRATAAIEKVAGYLGTLFREGPAGLWEQIQEDVGDLKDRMIEEVKSWAISRIVAAAVKKLAMMFNPVGAIVQAIITIYHVIMFFLENIDRILDLVRTVVRATGDIVRGRIQAAADKIETTMGMSIPLILSFLARLVGLGGIAEKLRGIITRFRARIEKVVTRFLRRLLKKFKVAAAKGVAGAKALGASLLKRFLPKKRFKAGGQIHTLWARLEGGRPVAVISSETQHLSDFLDWLAARKPNEISRDEAEVTTIRQATRKDLPKARQILAQIDTTLARMTTLQDEAALALEQKKLQRLDTRMAEVLSKMMGAAPKHPAPPIPQIRKYQLEGMTGPYGVLPEARHDEIEKDHQPQSATLGLVAAMPLFRGRAIQQLARDRAAGGTAINLHKSRHALSRTYGNDGKRTAKDARDAIASVAALAESDDTRRDKVIEVVRGEASKDADRIDSQVVRKPSTNRKVFGDIWKLTKNAQGISADPKEEAIQKEKIADSVKTQLAQGLGRVRSQDYGRLKRRS
jgi:hypothetical protein